VPKNQKRNSTQIIIFLFHPPPTTTNNASTGPTNPKKAPPFTVKSEAYTQMAQMFYSGEIDKNWTPNMVWDAYPQFQKYPLPAFHAQMYKYMTMNGLMVDDDAAAGGTGGGGGGQEPHGSE
jgi:hypothetical protein